MNDKTTQIEPELPELPNPIAMILGKRRTPENTSEFWGYFDSSYDGQGKEFVFSVEQMHAYALSAIAADRNKREGEPAATAVPYGWINAGTDRQQTEYATLHVGPENPWKETANAFPVYAAPVSAWLSEEEIAAIGLRLGLQAFKDAQFRADNGDDMPDIEQAEYDRQMAFARALESRLSLAAGQKEGYVTLPKSASDEILLAMVRAVSPALFRDGLRREEDGANTKRHVEELIDTARKQYEAAIAAAPLPKQEE